MQATAPHIANAEKRLPEHLALEGEVPIPCFRVLKGLALGGHHQRNAGGPTCSRIVDGARGYEGVGLEGWISSEEPRVAHAQAGDEAAPASANHRFVVDLVSNAQ